MKQKKGWIRIVEAVIALLIITGALLIAIGGGHLKKDISQKVYDEELIILKEISKDKDMREAIVAVPLTNTPTAWNDFDAHSLSGVKNKIEERTPSYLACVARICRLDTICESQDTSLPIDDSVYARSIAITATSTEYNPKQLKIFCYEKT
jgi:hypothetical protein